MKFHHPAAVALRRRSVYVLTVRIRIHRVDFSNTASSDSTLAHYKFNLHIQRDYISVPLVLDRFLYGRSVQHISHRNLNNKFNITTRSNNDACTGFTALMERLTFPLEGLADFLAFFFFFLLWPPETDDAEATAATPPRPSCWIAAGFSTATGMRMRVA